METGCLDSSQSRVKALRLVGGIGSIPRVNESGFKLQGLGEHHGEVRAIFDGLWDLGRNDFTGADKQDADVALGGNVGGAKTKLENVSKGHHRRELGPHVDFFGGTGFQFSGGIKGRETKLGEVEDSDGGFWREGRQARAKAFAVQVLETLGKDKTGDGFDRQNATDGDGTGVKEPRLGKLCGRHVATEDQIDETGLTGSNLLPEIADNRPRIGARDRRWRGIVHLGRGRERLTVLQTLIRLRLLNDLGSEVVQTAWTLTLE